MMIKAKAHKKFQARAGAALIVVLGIVMVITIVAFAYLSRSDNELAYGRNMLLRTQADFLAESALEHARGLVLNPQETSGEYWVGDTLQQIDSGDFYYDVSVEPNLTGSGSTQYCNYDVTCSGYRLINGERTAQSNLKALLRLDECIAYWSDTSGDRQLSSAVTINGDVYCSGDLAILGTATVGGDVFCDNLSGTIAGQNMGTGDLSFDWPRVMVSDFTSNYTVETIGSSILSSQVMGPYEPVRVCHRVGDLEIAGNVQITGMLIVEGDLVISGTGNSINAGKNVPALLVTGDVTIEEDAEIDIEGLAVIDGAVYVNVGCEDVNVLGAVFAGGGIVEKTKDISGNGFDAVVLSEPTWLPSGGQIAGATEFDGTGDKLENYDAGDYLNNLNAVTVSCWVKSDVTNQDRGIFFTREPTDGDEEIGLRYDRNGAFGGGTRCIKASLKTTSGYTQIESTSNVQTTGWQHLAITWESGKSLKLYINGSENALTYDKEPEPTGLGGTITGVEKFMLGCGTKDQYWDGLIDDVRIYSRVLDPNEVAQLNNGIDVSGDLIAHWELDEDGQREVVITAAPAKTAVWCWSASGDREKWAQAGSVFYKVIRRY